MSNKNEINILIPNDPLPLGFEMSKNWPINTKVNFIKTEYINYKPEPIKLKNIDMFAPKTQKTQTNKIRQPITL